EAVDDRPGLPPEAVTALLQRGGSGPRPVGPVPAPGAGLVDRHRGALTITPVDGDPGGCTAVLELPVTEPVEYR
ncbi:MAG TPA: ATP-binding protein, partial [Pseudonocardia sp.]|nr:ATP-binding protein [Pseudonocardia sp.]